MEKQYKKCFRKILVRVDAQKTNKEDSSSISWVMSTKKKKHLYCSKDVSSIQRVYDERKKHVKADGTVSRAADCPKWAQLFLCLFAGGPLCPRDVQSKRSSIKRKNVRVLHVHVQGSQHCRERADELIECISYKTDMAQTCFFTQFIIHR